MPKVIWFVPPAVHALAGAYGLLREAGVDPEARLTASSDEQFEALCEGACDFAVTSMDNVILWKRREGGETLRIVAQVEATIAIDLVAGPGIDSVADLAGKRILVDSAQNGFVIALRKLLMDAGVDYAGCTVIEAGGVRERLEALSAGRGDAALLGPPFTSMALERGLGRIASVPEAYPGFAGQGAVMREDAAPAVRAAVGRYLAALEEARARARAEPEEAAALLTAGGVPLPLVPVLMATVGETLVPARRGVAMLVEQRCELGLPGGDETYEGLVEPALLGAALASTRT